MSQRNPYDVLGVATNASQEEIRSTYIKRTKVLHPDRFDKSVQPVEWQMANDMLRELNEAYNQLRSQEPPHASNIYPTAPPFTDSASPPINAEESQIDIAKTTSYLHEIIDLYCRSESCPIGKFNPTQKNYDQHLQDLNRYIGVNFDVQVEMANLDQTNVDPLVLEAGNNWKNALLQFSKIVTERIHLFSRAKYLNAKYPYWKTLWEGYWSMGISTAEYKADNAESKTIDPRLIELGNQILAIQNNLQEQIKCSRIQLIGKYGNDLG